jgi:ribosomal protein L11 methyltransferase
VDRAELARRPEPDAVNLLLDPGLAFGTGTHPTTALCLEWLDGQDLKGLQRAGLRLRLGDSGDRRPAAGRQGSRGHRHRRAGAGSLRDNAGRNNIAEELFPLYLPEDLPQVQADVLVANILAGPLVSLAPQLSGLVKPGGAWRCRASSPSKAKKWPPPMPGLRPGPDRQSRWLGAHHRPSALE